MQMPRIPEWKGVATEKIKAFFLEASARTYAGGGQKYMLSDLPGSKVLRFSKDLGGRDFLYVDCYFSSGRRSFGQTVICVNNIPVWGMQYHGFWEGEDERVIPFLRRTLMAAYGDGLFCGGRGPETYQEETSGLIYRNYRLRHDGWDFTNFEGSEEIYDRNSQVTKSLLRHEYNGLLL